MGEVESSIEWKEALSVKVFRRKCPDMGNGV